MAERIRELSTIKVLGFYDKEVTLYIYRETSLHPVEQLPVCTGKAVVCTTPSILYIVMGFPSLWTVNTY